jgi:hypothetical protein
MWHLLVVMGSGGSQSRHGSWRIRGRTSWPPHAAGESLSRRHTQRERLGGRINVMEVKVDHAPVVAADRAAAACLGDKDPLDFLQAARHGLSDAALAAPSDSSLALAVAMKHHTAVPAAVAQCRGALRLGRPPCLRDQRHRCYGFCARHEHMFATTPDAKNAIMRVRAVSSMAERGTSTQKGALVGKPLVGRQLCAGTPLEPRVPKRDNPEDWAISRQPRKGEPSEAIRCPP